MASTPGISTGMSISAAGAGGLLTGASGFEGLFGALVGSEMAMPSGELAGMEAAPEGLPVEGAVPAGEGLISVLLGSKMPTVSGTHGVQTVPLSELGGLLAQTTVQTEVQLGDAPPLTVSGSPEAVEAFVAQVQEIYQKIVAEGKLTIGQLSDSQELAGALTELGMTPEEAVGVAERIQTMLKLLEAQQEVDSETAGSLVAMMLAVMGQQVVVPSTDTATAPQLGLQIISVEQQAATPTVTPMATWQMRASGDVTRDLLGLNKEPVTKELKSPEGSEIVRKVEVAVVQEADASVAVGVGELKTVHAPVRDVATDAVPSAAAQAAQAVTTTGAAVKVAAQEVIEAPKGETYYKLQADKAGVETLEAVKPMSDVRDAMVGTPQASAQPAQAAVNQIALAESEMASFAERVAQVNEMLDKAQVGRQVAVQMMPLLEQGGGSVRMTLNPESLGQVTVELQVVDGKVHGSISATEARVVEQLARELHNLRHGLADAGLKLGEQGINLMLSNQGQQGQDNQQARQGQQGSYGGRGGGQEFAGSDVSSELASNLASWVAPDRVLDVNV